VTVWLLTFNFSHFLAAFWAVFTFGGGGPSLTAHGSLDKKFKFKLKNDCTQVCSEGAALQKPGRSSSDVSRSGKLFPGVGAL
jgi:hypothetical protein